MKMRRIYLKNIGQAVTLSGPAESGIDEKTLGVVEDAVILIEGKRINGVFAKSIAPSPEPEDTVIDADGAVVLPGLIEPHTHTIFAGSREAEFAMRAAGKSYLEIAEVGGGILSTVNATRAASEEDLFQSGKRRLERFLTLGITTVEIKSGYGLNLETELKQLRVIRRLGRELPLTVVSTFLGAHALPPEFAGRHDDYIDLICREMIPEVARQKLADFCDVFCEKGFFTVEQSRRVLTTAAKHGLSLKLHADEFADTGGAVLAAELNATSADHLLAIGDPGLAALQKAKRTTAVLLPATAFSLGTAYAPARRLLDAGVPVALSTDFNPGSSFTQNLHLVMTMAATNMGMTVPEVIAAVTIRAAQALNLTDRGRIVAGARADLVFFDIPSYAYLPYRFGANFVGKVLTAGRMTLERTPD